MASSLMGSRRRLVLLAVENPFFREWVGSSPPAAIASAIAALETACSSRSLIRAFFLRGSDALTSWYCVKSDGGGSGAGTANSVARWVRVSRMAGDEARVRGWAALRVGDPSALELDVQVSATGLSLGCDGFAGSRKLTSGCGRCDGFSVGGLEA